MFTKKQYRRGRYLIRGAELGQFVHLRGEGELVRKSRVVILRREIDTPMHTALCLRILS